MGALRSAAMAMCLVACGPSVDQLRTRAAFDLECPEAQLVVIELDEHTSGVSGCGRQATYIRRETWIRNGP